MQMGALRNCSSDVGWSIVSEPSQIPGSLGRRSHIQMIFETALASVGARPEESLYVGDVYTVDYRGATEAGMEAVLFDVCGAYREKGLPRVGSLEELVERIG